LFERSKSRMPIRLHDLRATFVMVSLANGKTEQWVSDRTGHRSSQMLALYTRQTRQWNELELGALRPMDALLPEMATVASVPPEASVEAHGGEGHVAAEVDLDAIVPEGDDPSDEGAEPPFGPPSSERAFGEAGTERVPIGSPPAPVAGETSPRWSSTSSRRRSGCGSRKGRGGGLRFRQRSPLPRSFGDSWTPGRLTRPT
jgi:hypothetical protein